MWVRIRQGWATVALVVVTGCGAVLYAEGETARERAVPADRVGIPVHRTPFTRADMVEPQWFPCLTGTRYSLVTGSWITVAWDRIEVTPGFKATDEPTLSVVRDVHREHWRAADATSRSILAELGCT
ncbi:hypothetical protein ACFCWB_33290 [Streptomyces bacillaris]|uniref:hypothetical protein n=1 Tax=Streptomyces bacillaris TaxID=68179 RepID=UPI0035DC034E